ESLPLNERAVLRGLRATCGDVPCQPTNSLGNWPMVYRTIRALALITALMYPAQPERPAAPPVQSRVRATVPRLGPGWRVGMLSATLTQPPCYEVLLFDPGPVRRVSVIIPIAQVSRLQVSALYPGTGAVDPDPGASMYDGESWHEQDLNGLRGR